MALCNIEGCRLLDGHSGSHNKFPGNAWGFLNARDRNKISKAGFATPRGGNKNAYQNHVIRNNRVMIPFEKYDPEMLEMYTDGYIIRLHPEQYFAEQHVPKDEFLADNAAVQIGVNAFVLYRTWDSFNTFPPMGDWQVRGLMRNGHIVQERGAGVTDTGHYVLRLATHGANPKRYEGPPQGIFATEYADDQTNYLCRCALAFLITKTIGSPYTDNQCEHLKLILQSEELLDYDFFENNGTMRRHHTSCPLCQKIIRYNELHDTVAFEEGSALANAADQIEGSTRSTIVNLFHLKPLLYHSLVHVPKNVAWGHAICNSYLAQRECLSLHELVQNGLKVGIVYEDHTETFGWLSADHKFLRSPNGAVWIQISRDMTDEEQNIVEIPEDDQD